MHKKLRILTLLAATAAMLALALIASSLSNEDQRTAEAQAIQQQLTLSGFTVRFQDGSLAGTSDNTWRRLSGGAMRIETTQTLVGGDSFQQTQTGLTYIDVLSFSGPIPEPNAVLRTNNASLVIEGLGQASANVLRADIEPLSFSVVQASTGAGLGFKEYLAGNPGMISMSIEIQRSATPLSETFFWWNDTANGNPEQRTVTLQANDRDGVLARTWTFLECIPVGYSPYGEFSDSPSVAFEQVSVLCERVEFGQGSNSLRTPLVAWMNDYMQGESPERDVVITEFLYNGAEGRSYTYLDALPVEYVFPQYDFASSADLQETLRVQPTRLLID
jgi:hypothetical protein